MVVRPEGTTSTCARVQAAAGWKRRRSSPLFRLMFPEVRAHFESARQEEHCSTPAGMRTVALIQRRRSHPLAARSVGLSRAPAPVSRSWQASPARPRIAAELGGDVKWGGVAVDWVAYRGHDNPRTRT